MILSSFCLENKNEKSLGFGPVHENQKYFSFLIWKFIFGFLDFFLDFFWSFGENQVFLIPSLYLKM